jgi:tetratricopeptide (TPR) repeat protein
MMLFVLSLGVVMQLQMAGLQVDAEGFVRQDVAGIADESRVFTLREQGDSLRKKNPEQAVRCYEKALEICDRNSHALRADLYYRIGVTRAAAANQKMREYLQKYSEAAKAAGKKHFYMDEPVPGPDEAGLKKAAAAYHQAAEEILQSDNSLWSCRILRDLIRVFEKKDGGEKAGILRADMRRRMEEGLKNADTPPEKEVWQEQLDSMTRLAHRRREAENYLKSLDEKDKAAREAAMAETQASAAAGSPPDSPITEKSASELRDGNVQPLSSMPQKKEKGIQRELILLISVD